MSSVEQTHCPWTMGHNIMCLDQIWTTNIQTCWCKEPTFEYTVTNIGTNEDYIIIFCKG